MIKRYINNESSQWAEPYLPGWISWVMAILFTCLGLWSLETAITTILNFESIAQLIFVIVVEAILIAVNVAFATIHIKAIQLRNKK